MVAEADTEADVAAVGMEAAVVATATRLTTAVGVAALVVAVACASCAEAVRRCRALPAAAARLFQGAASASGKLLTRADAAPGRKQLPRAGRRRAMPLRRRAVLLPCFEATAVALRLQLRVDHCLAMTGESAV